MERLRALRINKKRMCLKIKHTYFRSITIEENTFKSSIPTVKNAYLILKMAIKRFWLPVSVQPCYDNIEYIDQT